MVIKNSNALLAVVAVAVASYLLGSFVGLPFVDEKIVSGDIGATGKEVADDDPYSYLRHYKLDEAVVKGKVPKKLNTFVPFWGVPQPVSGVHEDSISLDDYVYFRTDENSYPKWLTWNLDLASDATQRYKFDKFVPAGESLECRGVLCEAIDECYRWAWRKPYGNTNVVFGPLINPKDASNKPYAFFVAVCKQERLDVPMPLGFTSLAYMIPFNATSKNLSDYSLSVNAIESHCGYNLFSKLPGKVQNLVEEITDYEILFHDIDPEAAEILMPEMEAPEYTDDPRQDC